jgi:hypothetical protein
MVLSYHPNLSYDPADQSWLAGFCVTNISREILSNSHDQLWKDPLNDIESHRSCGLAPKPCLDEAFRLSNIIDAILTIFLDGPLGPFPPLSSSCREIAPLFCDYVLVLKMQSCSITPCLQTARLLRRETHRGSGREGARDQSGHRGARVVDHCQQACWALGHRPRSTTRFRIS